MLQVVSHYFLGENNNKFFQLGFCLGPFGRSKGVRKLKKKKKKKAKEKKKSNGLGFQEIGPLLENLMGKNMQPDDGKKSIMFQLNTTSFGCSG